MNRGEQAIKAELFRAMHAGPRVLVLPNAWDAISARIVLDAGFRAIATTSGGVAWALGYADGEAAPWDEVVAATARIARAVSAPVTADIETGYGDTPKTGCAAVGRRSAALPTPPPASARRAKRRAPPAWRS
jgi:2-methylisocitrate lyase-like PEP mutase family enzyme